MTRSLCQLYVAGEVRRWQQSPAMAGFGQTNADHIGRCMQILLWLHPQAGPALVRAVAFHNVGELRADCKRDGCAVPATLADRQTAVREAICGPDPWLTDREARWLKLIDGIEAAAYVLLTNPREANRPAARWHEARARLLAEALDLGCAPAVCGLFADLEAGAW